MHARHAVPDGRVYRCGFRQHTVCENATFPEFPEPLAIDVAYQRTWVVDVFEDARRARDENQFFGVEFSRDRCRNGIGVDI